LLEVRDLNADYGKSADREAGAADRTSRWALISEIARRGLAILLVEQKLSIALDISQRVYVMGRGRIFEGTPADLKANHKVRHELLEVCGRPPGPSKATANLMPQWPGCGRLPARER
jgi:ABC-type microcin C transport system duplicated ATPase subunit YejF